MPRLRQVDPARDTGPGADLLNGRLKNNQLNLFKGLATNPGVLGAYIDFHRGIKAGAIGPLEHEFIALLVGESNGCAYCLAAHTRSAKRLGLRDEDIANVRRGIGRSAKEQAFIDFTRALVDQRGRVSNDQLENFRAAGYDDAAVIEVIAGIADNTFTNYFNHVNETEID